MLYLCGGKIKYIELKNPNHLSMNRNSIMRIFSILLLSVLLASCDMLSDDNYIGMDYRNFNGTIAENLAKAVICEDVEDIKEEVIANKIPVDYKDPNYGHTLLHIAVMNKKEKSVETLLELGADPNVHCDSIEHEGNNAVILACDIYNPPIRILELLLKNGGDPNSRCTGVTEDGFGEYIPYRRSALELVISIYPEINIKKVKLLAKYGANLNDGDALSNALTFDDMETVLFLLEHGCDYRYDWTDNFDREDNIKVDILYRLRCITPELGSKEHKFKYKVINFLKKRGLDYSSTKVPKHIRSYAQREYPSNWQDYLKKY